MSATSDSTWFVTEESRVVIGCEVGENSGKSLKTLEFTVLGDPEKIDGGSFNRTVLAGEFRDVVIDMLDLANVDCRNDVFEENTQVHVDMFVKYSDKGSNSYSGGFMRRNEEELMDFLLDSLEFGVVGRESVVSKEVTKVCMGGTGGVTVSIKEIDE